MAFKRALPGMAALLLLAAAALAACGSPMTASERQAMDAESAEASSSESAAPLTAGILHTFACFTNASDIPITITWAGTNSNDGNGSIEPGKSRCGEGSTLKPWLTVPGASKPVNWEIYNRVIGGSRGRDRCESRQMVRDRVENWGRPRSLEIDHLLDGVLRLHGVVDRGPQ